MNKFFKNVFIATTALLTVSSCVDNDDFDIPPVNCNDRWEANTDIAAVKALNDTSTPFQITTDSVLEGYVVSSDETGNFFKSVTIQDSPSNPSAGMTIEMDVTNTYNRFPVGSRVLVDLNGLYVAKDRGSYKVGSTFDTDGVLRVGRMAEVDALAHVAASCDPVVEITPQSFSRIPDALNESNVNTLIRLENVQFQSAGNGQTYYDENNAFGGATNVVVEDSEGNTMVLRTGSFADFAADILPDGSGSLTAVLSAYSNSNNVTPSTFQMFIRDTSDVNFDQPRMEIVSGIGAIGGGNASYEACYAEDFTSFNADLVNFADYINYAYNGDRYWTVKDFGNNKYIQMTAFNANAEIETYFIVPVNFSDADTFSFKSKDGHNNGNPLSVYYTTSYQIGDDVNPASLTDITSEFTISTGNTNGYGETFVASGDYDLSGITGNGAIMFKYSSAGGVTTTIQLDDIMVVNNDDPNCGSDDGGNGGVDPEEPSEDAEALFAGYNFENWAAFTGGLNSFGLKDYATLSEGTGIDGSNSLHISTDPTTTDGNDYVFTSLAIAGLPTTYSKISFYMKGSSSKSVSLNVYKADGYYKYNLGDLTSSTTLVDAPSNQYTGTINTGGEWVLVTLDLSSISDLNVTDTAESLFALKIGKNADYDLHFDNFTIE